MKVTRIYKNKFYVLADHPGISGFRDWSVKEEVVVTGLKARNNKLLIVREFDPKEESGNYHLHDGHLPGHQPVAEVSEAIAWLNQNPFQSISKEKVGRQRHH